MESVMQTQKSKIVSLAIALFLMNLPWPHLADAQTKKIPRVGFLIASAASAQQPRLEAFKRGLRELGYIEGQNIAIEVRSGEGKPEQLPVAAAELVSLKVEVIVSGGPTSTRAAKQATNTIPIVMTLESDPVGDGLVASLARPGGNITGLSTLGPELSGKRLELLKEIVPSLSRVAVFYSTDSRKAPQRNEIEVTARALKVQLQNLELQGPKDIEPAFEAATKGRAGAVLTQGSAVLLSQRTRVAELAIKNRLPVIFAREEFVEAGGLAVYAASTADLARRAATFVDKLLKGAKPADLPVEQPMKFEFVINLKTAKQIGLTIPPNVLARADRVIK
jgi:putative ABC transport system substrate-binding protein